MVSPARSNIRNYGLAIVSSILLFLSFHPADWGFCAWFALAPWFYILLDCESPRRAAKISFIAGLVFFVTGLWWLTVVTYVGLVIAALILSLFAALFGFLAVSAVRKLRVPAVVAFPILWVAIEYARSNFFDLSFPWLILAHSQYDNTRLIQVCDLFGVFGLSAIMTFGNAVIAQIAFSIAKRKVSFAGQGISIGVFAALVLLTFLYGSHRVNSIKLEEGPKVFIVQGNIPQDLKEESLQNWGRLADQVVADHFALTAPALNQKIDLVIWPETMYPKFLLLNGEDLLRFSVFAKQSRAAMLIGTQHYEMENKNPKRYNSAVFIKPDGSIEGRYDKMFLVPVGEYVPLEKALPIIGYLISKFIPYETESLSEGAEMKVFSLSEKARFSCVVCFELSLDWLVRKARNAGADFIVNISNDGWFEGSAELDLARAHAAFRAVENRVPVVRAVNRGISCVADPLGRIKDLEVNGKRKNVEGALTAVLSMCEEKPLFLTIGNLFANICLLLAAAAAVLSLCRRAAGLA